MIQVCGLGLGLDLWAVTGMSLTAGAQMIAVCSCKHVKYQEILKQCVNTELYTTKLGFEVKPTETT